MLTRHDALLLRAAAVALTALPHASAEVVLPAVLRDGVVLKRDSSVPIWGAAAPNSTVTLRASWSNTPVTTVADGAGRFRAELPTGPAGGPHTLAVRDADGEALVADILLGEVWLCSGQSNMEWPLSLILPAFVASAAARPELADPFEGQIRLFHVPRRVSAQPELEINARWRPCTLEHARDFSAVAYFFARALRSELGVPIGLVGSYWGGTPSEAWTSPATIDRFPRYRAAREALALSGTPEARIEVAQRTIRWWREALDVAPETMRYMEAQFDDSGWRTVEVPGNWENGPIGVFDGIVWHRRTVEVPAEFTGRDALLSLGPIDDDDQTVWNGQWIGATGGWTTPRRYTVPADLLRAGTNVLAIAVHDSGGGGGFHGGPDELFLELADPAGGAAHRIPLHGTWRVATAAAPKSAYPRPVEVSAGSPSALFHGMIAGLAPFRFSGVIWYQGESNRYDPVLYRESFPALIEDWRAHFETPELPFLWAQIAPFHYGEGPLGAHRTALLREAQDRALAAPHTGQAILTDIGDVRDIHPLDKWTVGARLARQALAKVYGAPLDPDGPRYAAHAVEGSQLRIRFEGAEGGLVARDGELTWFYVAGEDRRFKPAVARIDGDSVLISHPEIQAPVAVRFAWSDVAEPNLFDVDGLPAAPFRTDDWDDVVIDG